MQRLTVVAVALALSGCAGLSARQASEPVSAVPVQLDLGVRSAAVITVDGLRFKDLNRSGALDPYEDWRLTPEARAADLTGRMTLHEKAGMMMHASPPRVPDWVRELLRPQPVRQQRPAV